MGTYVEIRQILQFYYSSGKTYIFIDRKYIKACVRNRAFKGKKKKDDLIIDFKSPGIRERCFSLEHKPRGRYPLICLSKIENTILKDISFLNYRCVTT